LLQCGKIGHKEKNCPLSSTDGETSKVQQAERPVDPTVIFPQLRPEYLEEFGSWMLIKKPTRKKSSRSGNGIPKDKNRPDGVDPDPSLEKRAPPIQNANLGNKQNRAKISMGKGKS